MGEIVAHSGCDRNTLIGDWSTVSACGRIAIMCARTDVTHHRWRKIVRWLALFSAVVALLALRACFFRPGNSLSGAHFNRGRNAAWLGVEWSMELHSRDQIRRLALHLREHQISTVYVYVSYLKPTGIFNPTYDYAQEFVESLKAEYPSVDVQAWLGIPVQTPTETPGPSGYIDLSDSALRGRIVEMSRWAVSNLGFDGVHLDPEPVVSGEANLLKLLDEVRQEIGTARLSISAREITPLFPEADLIINRWFTWRADYYREIAARVDQIAVMAYDSHAPVSWACEKWVQFQVIALTNSLKDSPVDIFIGIPTSEEHTSSHDPAVENMVSGLTGLVVGLNDWESRPDRITGVAIYPYWETSDDEWSQYRALWLDQKEK
jgi:hypothetical protein